MTKPKNGRPRRKRRGAQPPTPPKDERGNDLDEIAFDTVLLIQTLGTGFVSLMRMMNAVYCETRARSIIQASVMASDETAAGMLSEANMLQQHGADLIKAAWDGVSGNKEEDPPKEESDAALGQQGQDQDQAICAECGLVEVPEAKMLCEGCGADPEIVAKHTT